LRAGNFSEIDRKINEIDKRIDTEERRLMDRRVKPAMLEYHHRKRIAELQQEKKEVRNEAASRREFLLKKGGRHIFHSCMLLLGLDNFTHDADGILMQATSLLIDQLYFLGNFQWRSRALWK
jgi:hypothetical protein